MWEVCHLPPEALLRSVSPVDLLNGEFVVDTVGWLMLVEAVSEWMDYR